MPPNRPYPQRHPPRQQEKGKGMIFGLLVSLQHAEVYRTRHCLISGVVWVQVVAAVVFGLDVAGSRWIARERVEIDDTIELAARADPVVDCHADLLLIGV